jgi:hypothetical protein
MPEDALAVRRLPQSWTNFSGSSDRILW